MTVSAVDYEMPSEAGPAHNYSAVEIGGYIFLPRPPADPQRVLLHLRKAPRANQGTSVVSAAAAVVAGVEVVAVCCMNLAPEEDDYRSAFPSPRAWPLPFSPVIR